MSLTTSDQAAANLKSSALGLAGELAGAGARDRHGRLPVGGLQREPKAGQCPRGQWDGQPQASGASRAEADPRFLASLFPFHRKRHSFMHSNIY